MLKKTVCSLLTFGALVTGCYSGADAIEDRGLVVSAVDLEALPEGELLTVDLRADDATVLFDLSEGPIPLDRVQVVRPGGETSSLFDLVGTYGEALGIDLMAESEFSLNGAALSELAPLSAITGGLQLLLPSQSMALSRLPRIDQIDYNGRALPRRIVGDLGTMSATDPASGALAFVESLAPAFRFDGDHDFEVKSVEEDAIGQVHVRMQLYIDDLPVIGSEAIVHAELGSGMIRAFTSELAPLEGERLADASLIDGEAAAQIAVRAIVGAEIEPAQLQDLVYIVVDGQPKLAYSATVAYVSEDGPEVDLVFADARNGELLARHPQIHRAKKRAVYSANNGNSLPGTWKMGEGSPTHGDPVVQDAYDNAGLTYDYYKLTFNRDSYDNGGAQILSTVHLQQNYNNAYWNGSQMAYGDGDGNDFSPLSQSGDVVVHEITHAVTEHTAGLVYQNESGALNEAFSDIMAAAAQAWDTGTVSAATWQLAEHVWTPNTPGDAMRYMANPTQDGQSYDYYPTRYVGSWDNGGVHVNSGIANLAFKLAVTGGTHPQGKTSVNVPALGMAKAEQIFYRALTTYLSSGSTFQDARDATTDAAADLYGNAEVIAVHKAWDAVGVPMGSNTPPEENDPPNNGCQGVPYGGSLSGTGAKQYQPNGNYYYSNKSGHHTACMIGPNNANVDFDLYLQKWNGSGWTDVAKSESPTSSESIDYNGTAGYYAWRVSSWKGSGSYTISLTAP